MNDILFNSLDNPDGVYVLEKTNGKVYYIKAYKNRGEISGWVVVTKDNGQIGMCHNDRDKPGGGWFADNVASIVHHPNMSLKGVPCINTD